MMAARQAALDLADALEQYIRRGTEASWNRAFQPACEAANHYRRSVTAAEKYHFAVIPRYSAGHVINLDGAALLAVVRELRGRMRSVVEVHPDGRKTARFVPSEDGIAGFFELEVRSMRRFGKPRRAA